MTEYSLRWLVHETWKPVAGRSVEVFNALSGTNAVPEDGAWRAEEPPSVGHVAGEVIGQAMVEAHANLPNCESAEELREVVEARGEVLRWEDGWGPTELDVEQETLDEAETLLDKMTEDEAEPSDDAECAICGESHADGACWDDDDDEASDEEVENSVVMIDEMEDSHDG